MNLSTQSLAPTARATRTLLVSHDDGCFYVVSTIAVTSGAVETLVFPARVSGETIECTDVAGGRGVSHEDAIARMRALSAADVAARLDIY